MTAKEQPWIGEFFTFAELLTTSTGLPNIPDATARNNLRELVSQVLDPLRRHLAKPVRVTSGFRSLAVNRKVGGSSTSAHVRGEAADIKVTGLEATDLVNEILRAGIPFDQVIGYAPNRGGHVHIALRAGGASRQRRELLYAPSEGGYRPFVVERPIV